MTARDGHWVSLVPLEEADWRDASHLEDIRRRTPHLGSASGRADVSRRFGPAMVISDRRSGVAFGLIENGEMSGYPGVAVVVIFVDQSLARPGVAMEAFALYVAQVFEAGAALVHLEVLEFNSPVLRMLSRIGLTAQARLREHLYVSGRFWDVLVFAFDRPRFEQITARYADRLPGGDRRPAAIGARPNR
jgi:RimJ/RimL family protein N-acetyltransferase